MNRNRIVLNAVLVVALVGGGGAAWQSTQSTTSKVTTTGTVETVKKADLVATVSASGNIESATATSVNFSQAGTVLEVLVKEGQTVKARDVLARIDDSALQIALQSAKASLTSAQAKAAKTKSGLTSIEVQQNRATASQSAQSVSSAETSLTNARETAEVNKQTYQLSIDQAEASLVAAKETLTNTQKKSADDIAAAQVSADTARTSLETAKSTAAHDDETARINLETAKANAAHDDPVAQASVNTATSTLTESQTQLEVNRKNLDTAQQSFDAKAKGKGLTWTDTVSRYTDAQTRCKEGISAYDDIPCGQVSYLLSLAQAGQKQESSVTQNQTALTNAENSQISTRNKGQSNVVSAQNSVVSTKDKGQSSITSAQTSLTNALNTVRTTTATAADSVSSAEDKVTSAKNTLDNAKNTQKTNLLKDAQSITTAEESVMSAKKSYEVQVAGNRVKEKPATADQLAADQSSIVAAEDQVKKAQESLDDTVLKAPIDATVASVNGAVGDSVTTGGSQTAFVTLTDPNVLRVKVGFSEADALRLNVGQRAKVTMDAASERVFTGTVTSVDTTQTIVNNVVTYYATVNLVGDLDGLKAGMSASVDVTTAERKGVLTLPTRVIKGTGKTATVSVRTTSKDSSGKSVEKDSPTQVTVGLRGDDGIEITSGLTEGQRVVVQSTRTGGLPGGFTPPGGGIGGGLR